ncbi:BatD family protein [Vaginella massiliensis]|uniref:BatD family protein n=1 Tax=Vaginella massiliensis TaxID=1816680 RepID=UPI000838BA71|nr:BatD family protein [Vaginella massiliensis]
MKKLSFLYLLFFAQLLVFAQVESSIEPTQIKIGEPIRLTYQLPFSDSDKIQIPSIQDTLSYHIEVLEQKLDTIKRDGSSKLELKLRVTSYEAGRFLIKPLAFVVNQDTVRSASYQIIVHDVIVDEKNPQLADNKPIMLEDYTLDDYWKKYWIYGIVALLLLLIAIVLVILYIRSKSKGLNKQLIKTPFEEMMDELKSIDKKKYLQRGEQKEYYSRLSLALKHYIGRVYHFSAKELLSDEVVDALVKKEELKNEEIQTLKQFLYDADLVKFAKQTLPEEKNTSYRKWVEDFVNYIKPIDIPQNPETNLDSVTGENYRKIKD